MNLDDLEPRNVPKKSRDLGPMSVAELEAYIGELEAEIARARAAIAAKQSQRSVADSVFRT